MFMGVALLGLLAGSLASFFGLESDEGDPVDPETSDESVRAELALLRAEVRELADLREQLAALTAQLSWGGGRGQGTQTDGP
jgi:hypothetical protein